MAGNMDKLYNKCDKQGRRFIPKKTPRYLHGSVKIDVEREDLKEYNKHLYKVFTANPKVDDMPPKFHFDKYLGFNYLIGNRVKMQCMEKQNKELLLRINVINRSHGIVDTFNKFANANNSKWPNKIKELRKLNEENKKLYHKLVNTKPLYPKSDHDKFWKAKFFSISKTTKFPLVIFEKKTKDQILRETPSISKNIQVTEDTIRPKCFLEFKIQEGLGLGKIIIELYQDQVPETVKHFLSLCRGENGVSLQNCPVNKIFPDKFSLMGDTTNFKGKGDTIEIENHLLQHTRPGVLSMVPTDNHKIEAQFCLTFVKMPDFNEKYVVIGKVIRGAETLQKVNDFGSKFGRPISKMIISNCGVFEKTT